MKVCTDCEIEKEETEYYPRKNYNKGGGALLMGICKRCCSKDNKSRKEYKAARRITVGLYGWLLSKYEGIPCMDCNKSWPWCAMDFDHKPGEVKEFEIARVGHLKATTERIARVEKEIAKCDLVCASCHRVRTFLSRS